MRKAQPAQPVVLVRKAQPAQQATKAQQDSLELWVLWAKQVGAAHLVHKEIPATLEQLAQPVLSVHEETLATLATLAQLARREQPVSQVRVVQQEYPVRMVLQVQRDHRVLEV